MNKKNKGLHLFVQQIAQPKMIIASLSGLIIMMVLLNFVIKPDFNYLTQTFNYTPEYAYQLLYDIGEDGRASHLLVLAPDILLVLLYTALLLGANYAIADKLTRCTPKNCIAVSVITFSPLILSIMQLAEIAVLAVVLLQYPKEMPALIALTNRVTMIKTILTVFFFLMPVIGLLALGVKRIFRRNRT